ncbi:MAG: hypothetical protein ABW278_09400 [Steroidobacteraceae bacterium]
MPIVIACSCAALLQNPATAADTAGTGCEPREQSVVQVMARGEVTTYGEAGEFSGRIAAAAITTGVPVLACRDMPGRQVKVQVAGKAAVWVDRLQVKIAGAVATPVRLCKDKPPSDRNDAKRPAVSGIDPCSG